VSRRVELLRSLRSPCSKPKLASSICGGLLQTLVRRYDGATSFLFGDHGPYDCLRDGYCISICALRLFLSSPISSSIHSFLRHFLRTTTAMIRKKITIDELSARTKANCCQRGAHRDKDSLRDLNKHIDIVKNDLDAALDLYVL
jgi:hypothetical protein